MRFTTFISDKEDLPEDDIFDLNPEVVVSVPDWDIVCSSGFKWILACPVIKGAYVRYMDRVDCTTFFITIK